jgi:hypothetical protein
MQAVVVAEVMDRQVELVAAAQVAVEVAQEIIQIHTDFIVNFNQATQVTDNPAQAAAAAAMDIMVVIRMD